MPAASAHTPSELDLGIATRQAIGAAYERPRNLDEQLQRLNVGIVRLRPHGDWSGDYTDWHADPFTDRNWQFQFHSLRWIMPLRWAALDGDESARSEWLRIVRSWFDENVPFQPDLAPFAWKDMTDGNRSIHLSLGAPLARPGDVWFVELLHYHRDWLMDPAHIKGKNHGLHQHAGLLVVGAALRDREAMDTAVARMEKQFLTTFDEQGCNDEGSVGYQQHNLKWWQTAWQRAESEGYSVAGVPERISAGAHVLAHLTLPDGQMPQIGDTARGQVSRDLHPFTEFAATRGVDGEQPEGKAIVLDGGYVISRSGWGEARLLAQESHMVLRHGPDVRAHSHQDRGSLHIYASGSRWFTDSGFYSYQQGDPTRRYLSSREAHNIAFLPGLEHDPSALVELVSHSVTESAHDFTIIDRGYEDGDVERRVIYFLGPDCWFVMDSATSPETVRLTQHWHLEPGTESRFRDRGFRLTRNENTLNMTWLGRVPSLRRHTAMDGDLRAWIGTSWKTLVAGTRLTASSTTSVAHRIVTLISPNTPHPLGVVDSRVHGNGSLTATLVRAGRVWNVRVDGPSAIVSVE